MYVKRSKMKQQECAMAICSSHVHIIMKASDVAISDVVRHLKRASTYILWQNGIQGKVWTKGYDKRYCFNMPDLQHRVEYVLNHEDAPPTIDELCKPPTARVEG